MDSMSVAVEGMFERAVEPIISDTEVEHARYRLTTHGARRAVASQPCPITKIGAFAAHLRLATMRQLDLPACWKESRTILTG